MYEDVSLETHFYPKKFLPLLICTACQPATKKYYTCKKVFFFVCVFLGHCKILI